MKSPPSPSAALDALSVLSNYTAQQQRGSRGVLEDALDMLLAATGASRGAVHVVRDGLELVSCIGLPALLKSAIARLPGPEGEDDWFIAQRAARLRHAIVEDDIFRDAPAGLDAHAFTQFGWVRAIASPIARGGDVLGVIVLAAPDEASLPASPTLQLLTIASRLLGFMLETREARAAKAAGHTDRAPSSAPAPRHTSSLPPQPISSRPPRSSWPSSAPPPRNTSSAPPRPTRRITPARGARLIAETAQDGEQEESPPLSARCQELTILGHLVAEAIRREGPMRGSQVVTMLRARGLSETQALSVITFGLSTEIFLRDPERPTYLRVQPPDMTTVLVVDDDDELRASVRRLLEDEGYAVETAENGLEALRVLHRRPAQIVLLDMIMPVMDGWQFLSALERDRALSTTPVVVISGGRALPKPSPIAVDVLRKPLDFYKLVTTIERTKLRVGVSP